MLPKILLSMLLWLSVCNARAQQLYFPPLSASATWETTSPGSLGWCTDNLDTLYDFLDRNNSKAFLVLKDGKIVLEKYFGTFTKDSSWYWASAGKSLTSLLIGKAQEEGLLSIEDSSSKYLGAGWTDCTAEQERKITIHHQITMTSGLDDGVADNHCTDPSCLIYKADAGTRWAYHNAPYTLLDGVLTAATGQTMNVYTQLKVKSKTGMDGIWFKLDEDNIYFSTPRSMARYGLLAQHNFIWDTDTLLSDTAYKNHMISTSQSYNLSYGYLWWLNGKSSYMVPSLQLVIPGSYAPNAPSDMFAAIGKNGQIASISKSNGLVVIRMGDAPGSDIEVPTQFCDQVWLYLNKVICNRPSGINEHQQVSVSLFPNPAADLLHVTVPEGLTFKIVISDLLGNQLLKQQNQAAMDISVLSSGIYIVTVETEKGIFKQKLMKQ